MPLAFSESGPPTHRPLLFIHGLGASRQQTVSVLTQLTDTRLIAPDMPGHGNSPPYDPDLFCFDYFADLIIELMDSLEIAATDLGGVSMGSGIALNLALRYPDRVKRMIIVRPSWLDQTEPAHLSLVAKVGRWLQEADEETATMRLALDPAYQELVAQNVLVAESVTKLLDRRKDPASNAVLLKMWQSRPFERLTDLARVTNPALVLDTTRDELHPRSVARRLADSLPNTHTATLPPRYHEGKNYQKALNQQLNDFL